MLSKQSLMDNINWTCIMQQGRFAGGHENIMENLFLPGRVAASWIEEDYQGQLAFAYRFGQQYALITDYFGSCSGCDAWEDATDEEVRSLVKSLVSSARLFDTLEDTIEFLFSDVNEPENYSHWAAKHLLPQLILKLQLQSVDQVLHDMLHAAKDCASEVGDKQRYLYLEFLLKD